MVAGLAAAWLLLAAAACAQREQDFYDFKAVNIRGKLVSLEKYRGSVSVRPPGLGAIQLRPDGGARRPGTLPGVAPRGSGRPATLPWLPTPTQTSRRARRPQILRRVCPSTTWHGPARGETRNSRCRRRFPSQRFWAAGPSLSHTGLKSNPSILGPLSLPSPVSTFGTEGVGDNQSSENIVEMKARYGGSYHFRHTGTLHRSSFRE